MGVFLPARLVVARPSSQRTGRNVLKSYEVVMEILEAFALTNSYRAAGELAGCSHHTVEHYVRLRPPSGRRLNWMPGWGTVRGHEILPVGGHETAHWWPTELPTGGQWDCPR